MGTYPRIATDRLGLGIGLALGLVLRILWVEFRKMIIPISSNSKVDTYLKTATYVQSRSYLQLP